MYGGHEKPPGKGQDSELNSCFEDGLEAGGDETNSALPAYPVFSMKCLQWEHNFEERVG
jgi:hypothetical protein